MISSSRREQDSSPVAGLGFEPALLLVSLLEVRTISLIQGFTHGQ